MFQHLLPRTGIHPARLQNAGTDPFDSAADVLVTNEGLGDHQSGWKALDDLALAMGVEVVIHGHLHETNDYVAVGRLDPSAGYQVFGVAAQHPMTWPRRASPRAGRPR